MSNRSLPTDCQIYEKIFRTVLLKAASHHIHTGRHRLHEEPVPAEMNRRDDLLKRDPTSPELPILNKDIHNRICVHKRKMRGANCGTDHQMLRSRVIFSIKKNHNKKRAMKPVKLNTIKLRNTSHAESLLQEMDNALAQSSEDNKTHCWTSFQQVMYDNAKASLGKHEKKHKDWFDPNDQILRDLMAKRDEAHQRVLQIRNTRSYSMFLGT